MPARGNRENLDQGNTVYKRLLGRQPSLAYINEQVFSAGLPKIYTDAGYKALMVNWESSDAKLRDSDLIYKPCSVEVDGRSRMPIIWHSIRTYRNFQRYVEGETNLQTYLDGVFDSVASQNDELSMYQFYGSDWEVFDFKPWLAQPEGFPVIQLDEMPRIIDLFKRLKEIPKVEFVTPSNVFDLFDQYLEVTLENSANPLPYKKQDLHSVSRWAVSGRDGVHLNTECYKLSQTLTQIEWCVSQTEINSAESAELSELWKDLCYLWGSDFRTFATEEKFSESRRRIGAALYRAQVLKDQLLSQIVPHNESVLINCSSVVASEQIISCMIHVDESSETIPLEYNLCVNGIPLVTQNSHQPILDDHSAHISLTAIPQLEPGQIGKFSINKIKQSAIKSEHPYSVTDGGKTIETNSVRLALSERHGGTIESLAFPSVHVEPLLGSGDISGPQSVRMADFVFCGDSLIKDLHGRTFDDHQRADITGLDLIKSCNTPIYVDLRCVTHNGIGTIWKTYRVYLDVARVDLSIRFQLRDIVPEKFRVARMVLNSSQFNASDLRYSTTNGGTRVEEFPLSGTGVRHDEPMDGGSSARSCLGATESWLVIRDSEKGVGFVTYPSELYSVPMIHFESTGYSTQSSLFMVSYSLGERDETSHTFWRGHSTWRVSIIGGTHNIIEETSTLAALGNGGLIMRPSSDEIKSIGSLIKTF